MQRMRSVPRTALIAAVALLLLGAAIRVAHLDTPPLDFHATRQYRSAIIARGESSVALAALPENQRPVAVAARRAQGRIEPEIIETIAVAMYRLIGREDLRAPRVVSIVSWLGCAVAVAWLARLLGMHWGFSITALGFTLLAPFGISASRAFMPDPLMTALTMAGLAVLVWHHQGPSTLRWLLRGATIGAALYVKPMSLFFLAPPLLAVDIARNGLIRGASSAAVTLTLAALPTGLYYLSLMRAGNPVAEARILPELLTRPTYWRGWFEMIGRVIGWPAVFASLAGVALIPALSRYVLAAAWLGYVVFGLLFTHHISTHDYYSLPIVPLAAISIAALLSELTRRAGTVAPVVTPLVLAAIAAPLVPAFAPSRLYGDTAALRQVAADYARIGALVEHRRTVSLDGSYGFPLNYHGVVESQNWPLSFDRALFSFTGGIEMPAAERLSAYGSGFFVATQQLELDVQPDLEQLLDTRYSLIERRGTPDHWRYVVYDLRTAKLSATPDRLSLHTRAGSHEEEASIDVWAPDRAAWRAESDSTALLHVDTSGTVGPGRLKLIARPQTPGPGQDVKVRLISDVAVGVEIVVGLLTKEAGANAPPFGVVDIPVGPVTVADAPVVFQGWALDDLSLKRVEVLAEVRDRAAVSLGDVRLAGARPDIAAAFPQAHDLLRTAWIFELRPERIQALPRPVTLLFRGVDGDGAVGVIGRRTIN